VQQRTVAAPDKPAPVAGVDPAPERPVVVARADPAPPKPANAPRADAAPAQAHGPIVGNTRTKFYHFPGCPNYLTIAPQARIEFALSTRGPRLRHHVSARYAHSAQASVL
jgi:hypothetical protein